MQAKLFPPPVSGSPIRNILQRFIAATRPNLSTSNDQGNGAKLPLDVLRHELRTPLVGILGMSELLRGSGLNREQRLLLLAMEESVRQMNHLIGEVGLEGGAITFGNKAGFRSIEAVDFLEKIVRAHWHSARDRGIDLHLLIDQRLPATWNSDRRCLRQVLDNLLANAVKFTKHGFVMLEAILVDETPHEPGRLELRVTDTGPGIPIQDNSRIYEIQEQGNSEVAQSSGGSGLGLAICSHLAGRLGATLGHEPNPDGGVRFTLSLPLVGIESPSSAFRIHPKLLSGQQCLILLRDPMKSVLQNLLGQMAIGTESADTWLPQPGIAGFDGVFCNGMQAIEQGWAVGTGQESREPLLLWRDTADVRPGSRSGTGFTVAALPQPLLLSNLEPLLLQLALQRKLRKPGS